MTPEDFAAKKMMQMAWLVEACAKQHGNCNCELCRKLQIFLATGAHVPRRIGPNTLYEEQMTAHFERWLWE
jgi:hypothetical protein